MTGGNINAIADLVYRNVPMTSPYNKQGEYDGWKGNILRLSTPSTKMSDTQINIYRETTPFLINDRWTEYIDINTLPVHGFSDITISFKKLNPPIDPNQHNSRGQTLLYLAALNCNKQMFDALVAMGAGLTGINSDGSLKGINIDGSTILHGIAWGSIKIYEKVAFMQEILQRYPLETIPLLFQVNIHGETCYDNLLKRHPDKISKSLEDVAFPLGWVKRSDTNERIYYENTSTGSTQWDRPY